ncbi:hypothetical protein [Sulfitobacter pontiacus]|uniref:hypothetical protein n=1 Tax=Sulfitobacter pontiacus TaxID=60137 RepID=UPI00104880CC|nr:hypothetical protein [Sulfitobacter pontiacus]
MAKITYEDRARLFDPLDRDRDLDERQLRVIRSARLSGLRFKRRNSRQIKNLPPKIKRAIVGQNRAAISRQRAIVQAARRKAVASNKGSIQHESVDAQLMISRYRRSILLDGLVQGRDQKWKAFSKRLRTRKSQHIEIENFSFVDAPRRTMEALSRIAHAETECLQVSMDFLEERCLDVGPWLLLAIMRKDMAPVIEGAFMHQSLSKVISELKLDRSIGIVLNKTWPTPTPDVWAFPVEERRASGSTDDATPHLRPQTIEKVGTNMVKAINHWLKQCVEDQNLTVHGQKLILKIVGETLDNAERHSRPDLGTAADGEWMVSGFMARRNSEAGDQYLRCHLAFLSIGTSIADSIKDCPLEIAEKMGDYVSLHRSHLGRMKYADAHLRTVYALQDGVTRDERAFSEDRSGSGFGSILAFFKDLAGADGDKLDATLSIVSGNTCLRIPYDLAPEFLGVHGETRNIWLNESNDGKIPPHHDAVIELERRLNGTLITMAFNLDADYLKRTADAPD